MKNNITVKKRLVLKEKVKIFINKVLITILIFLVGMILVKDNSKYKNNIINNVYEKSFKFTKLKDLYEKYFGKVLSVDKIVSEDEKVFNEKLSYKKLSKYKDGVKLDVSNKYMVPSIESGIVVFIGEKEGYGNTIIIEQVNGVDVYYSNINPSNIKLYDYIEKGKLLGEVKDNKLYMVFQKDGKYLNYKKYL
ncbi:peptidoglycan DD-metalloendopeptidase family protein [Candidatus Ruminimicrobium bovinum]|uniref:peptidoglycan DD-metalloendopeptidase family protein n=1 Tax=Candidatus Ruminimicrobium bovinum TaxID=3242779 RepID=UPI0039B9D092